ncbi:MAG: fructose PTS transporter subunit IIA [Bacillota bacterium]
MIELIGPETICMDLGASTKEEAIAKLADMLDSAGKLRSRQGYIKTVLEREALTTTGIGMGIAIPHGKSAAVREAGIAFGKSACGIDWTSLDGQPTRLVFLLAVPEEAAGTQHLQILARLARMLMDDGFRNDLMSATTPEKVLEVISRSEKGGDRSESTLGNTQKPPGKKTWE